MVRVSEPEFDEARARFLQRLDTGLSLTDWSIVVQCERRGIGTILSFHKGLDGVYPRNALPPA
jgi:predicted nucleic acid-binding protein